MSPNNLMTKTKDVLQAAKGNTNRILERKSTGNARTFFKGALAKQVKTDELSPDDIIIAVMGPTGSGKSSFINAVTGLETGVGHDLESCTSKVSNVRLSIPEMAFADLVFVDTPGFDDTHKQDVDILKMVADWLKSTYEKNIFLSGLLYFHRISDNRMAGTPLKNLRMFEQLCGKNAFHNVILTTTMWDEVDERTGEERERELKTNYWRTMLERRSTTSRFLRTRESAFNLIDPLIEAANKKISVLLQDELVDMRKSLPATAAGQELFSAMGQLVSQREDLLRRIRQEMRRSDGDKMILEPLREEHQKLQNNLEATVNEMRRLRLPLGQRLLIMMRNKFISSKIESFKSFISKTLSKPALNDELPISSPQIESYTDADHPLDPIHQSPGSSHVPLPNPNGSNISQLEQEITSGMDQSKHTKTEENRSQTNHSSLNTKSAPDTESRTPPINSYAPLAVSLADPLLTSKDLIHQSSPGSTSHVPHPITNVSQLGQGPASGTDQSKHTKTQGYKPTISEENRSQTNPVESKYDQGASSGQQLVLKSNHADSESYLTRYGSSPVGQETSVSVILPVGYNRRLPPIPS